MSITGFNLIEIISIGALVLVLIRFWLSIQK